MINIIILILSWLAVIAGLIYKFNKRRHRKCLPANGKTPGDLSMVNWVGTTMLGEFEYSDEFSISYYCFAIGPFPIIPLGCYWCEDATNLSGDCPAVKFYGTQPWNTAEVLQLYSRWGWISGVISLFILIV